MFLMQQDESPKPAVVAHKSSSTPEEQFGATVQKVRTQLGISQRKFAELLTEKGMPVDASAVSRIEKGSRSVRLVEAMAIAEVLDMTLESLTRDARSPSQRLQALRQTESFAMHTLETSLVDLGLAMTAVQDFLRENPGLLGDVVGDDGSVLDDAEDYFEWSATSVANSWMAWVRAFVVRSEAERESFVRMVSAMARCYPVLEVDVAEEAGEDGIDSEKA